MKRLPQLLDTDKDGLHEQMIIFDQNLVSQYLLKKGLTEGTLHLMVSGTVDGRTFEGIVKMYVSQDLMPPESQFLISTLYLVLAS